MILRMTEKYLLLLLMLKAAERALKIINNLTREVEVGEIYLGKVQRITTFGAFIEILPGKEGLCHISQLGLERVEKVEDVVSVGDEILVKVTEIDRQGRINLSRKEVLKEQEKIRDEYKTLITRINRNISVYFFILPHKNNGKRNEEEIK